MTDYALIIETIRNYRFAVGGYYCDLGCGVRG